jgi:hypothetical protein
MKICQHDNVDIVITLRLFLEIKESMSTWQVLAGWAVESGCRAAAARQHWTRLSMSSKSSGMGPSVNPLSAATTSPCCSTKVASLRHDHMPPLHLSLGSVSLLLCWTLRIDPLHHSFENFSIEQSGRFL